jgi:hypothetical protein
MKTVPLKIMSALLLGLGMLAPTVYACTPSSEQGSVCFSIEADGDATSLQATGSINNLGAGRNPAIDPTSGPSLTFYVTDYHDIYSTDNITKGSQNQTGTFDVYSGDVRVCSGQWTHEFYTSDQGDSLHDRFWASITEQAAGDAGSCFSDHDSEGNAQHDSGSTVKVSYKKLQTAPPAL